MISIPEAPDPRPDIYYIILDGYPNNEYLRKYFGIENSDFTDELEQLGFYIAYDALSNYTFTFASVGSSLNLNYLDQLVRLNQEVDLLVLGPYLTDNIVGRSLQKIGYKYVYLEDGHNQLSEVADFNVIFLKTDEILYVDPESVESKTHSRLTNKRDFMQYVYATTLLRVTDPSLTNVENMASYSWQAAERIKLQLDALKEISRWDVPTFTYFHLIKPHLPITADANGEEFVWSDVYDSPADYRNHQEDAFADQLSYINRQVLATLEEILDQSSVPPIIILQGDHGTQLSRDRSDKVNNPIAILSAFYFPGRDYSGVPQDISPVNIFRLIFNRFFGLDLEILPNKYYYQPQDRYRQLFFELIPDGEITPPFD